MDPSISKAVGGIAASVATKTATKVLAGTIAVTPVLIVLTSVAVSGGVLQCATNWLYPVEVEKIKKKVKRKVWEIIKNTLGPIDEQGEQLKFNIPV